MAAFSVLLTLPVRLVWMKFGELEKRGESLSLSEVLGLFEIQRES